MTWILSGLLSVLCVVAVSGLSMAGTADGLQDQAEERNQAAQDAHEREMNMEEAAGNITEAQKERAIEAQRATQHEAGGIVDQLREGAKSEVNQKSKGINSTIDNFGK